MGRELTEKEWVDEAVSRFGEKSAKWAFVCPACGFRQTLQDYKDGEAPESAWAFSCVGRWSGVGPLGEGPCNYAGGGFLKLNPVRLTTPEGVVHNLFEFAPEESEDG